MRDGRDASNLTEHQVLRNEIIFIAIL